MSRWVSQVQELHETEVLHVLGLILEEWHVECFVVVGSDLNELRDLEEGVTVLVLAHTHLVAREKLNDSFEEVGADVTNGIGRELMSKSATTPLLWYIIALTRPLLNSILLYTLLDHYS